MDIMDSRILKLLELARGTNNWHESQAALKKATDLFKQRQTQKAQVAIPRLPSPTSIPDTRTWRERLFPHKITAIKFSDLVKIEREQRVTLQIIPDRDIHSGVAVESILHTFHSMYEHFMERFWTDGFQLVFKTKAFASFRIVYRHKNVTFYLSVPKSYQETITNAVYNVWGGATIKVVEKDIMQELDEKKASSAYVELKNHYFKSTLVNRTKSAPMPSLMAAGRNVIEDDLSVLDVTFIPVSDRWKINARAARDKFRKGEEPKLPPKNVKELLFMLTDFVVENVVEKILGFADLMFMGEKEEASKKKRPQKEAANPFHLFEPMSMSRQLEPASENKVNHNGFDVVTRIVSQSTERARANLTVKQIGTALKDLNADNEFEVLPQKSAKDIVRQLKEDRLPAMRLSSNILSIPEASQILQMPSGELQQTYPEIESITQRQADVSPILLKGGIELGEVSYRDEVVKTYAPIDDLDELCLPSVGVGGMGQGKSKGFAANQGLEAYRNGFSSVLIDPNKKEIAEQIRIAIKNGEVDANDVTFIDLGKGPISLDWREALHSDKARGRLAGTAIDFFDIQKDTTGQTERFLRAAIMAMETGTIKEIMDIFENEDRLDRAIKSLPEGSLNRISLEEYKGNQIGRRRQILSPIYNRLAIIMSDPHLEECLNSDNSLDFVELTSKKKKIIVIDVSSQDLDKIAIDVAINLLATKLDLAMRLRKKVKGPDAEVPLFVCLDEPHQFLRSAKLWKAAVVEARKWRYKFIFTFQYFEQVPEELRDAITNALCHYHLYPSSEKTFAMLKHIIKPFTVDNAMSLQRWHAINSIVAGGKRRPAFVAEMMLPAEKRFKKKAS